LDAAPPPRPTANKDANSTDGTVGLGGQYIISANEPVPALAGPAVTAVAASDRRTATDALAALICSGDVLPRVEVMAGLRGLSKPGLLPLRDFGPVDWVDKRQRLAAIYAMPRGGRFTLATPMVPYQIIDSLLRPAIDALREIHSRGFTYRAIRPDNLFLRDAGSSVLALGPCVATPAGHDQPEIYEPIETAPADPTGRSDGSPRHDLFALGMTALALLLGRQPGSEFGRDELMVRRLEWGSFGSVVDPSTVPPEIVDALAGMLTDSGSERWTLKDLELWLRGGRPDPPRIVRIPLAAQPYTLAERQVRTAKSFAYMVGRNWNEGARHLRSEELQRWLTDQAGDLAAASLVDQVVRERNPEDGGTDGGMLIAARAVMALDTLGPLRFGGLAVDPNGLGPFLVDAARSPEKRELAVAMIDQRLPQKLMELRPPDRRRTTRQAINFERLHRWTMSAHPWEGLERCLYDLNPYLPCLSPLTANTWVGNTRTLVTALDQAASSGAEMKIDKSMAAFLSARADADGETLKALMQPHQAAPEAARDAIRLFADLQRLLDSTPLHGLTKWFGGFARRLAESIHHRPTRKMLLEKIDETVPEGRLSALLKVLDIDGLTESDARGFLGARGTWQRLDSHAWALERDAEMRKLQAWRRGRDNVPIASGGGAILAFLGTLFLDSAK
jgi:serine/threonine protein kinase